VALKFDSTGNLLLTCDSSGHYFNLFRILPFPASSAFSAVHHLYSLYRGDTPGSVQVKYSLIHLNTNRNLLITVRVQFYVFEIYVGSVNSNVNEQFSDDSTVH